ncbi:hypothetical protein HRD68_00125 (plasmid) [Yersinia massiliensis]|uniref:hypothetical protein n=1 Tax=Yersinia massiliensis TaxID=419257 RepID=UPI0015620846|nr:hypothetical protein [Yersinia massiliensis]QKJ09268.1 hypothetical protein HRD68_00125 [Yersinia massiliensis]
MGTRIENPNVKGACFIAENILLRLNKDAVRRCGSFDLLHAVFFKENVYEFADALDTADRERFLLVAREVYSGFDENVLTLNEAMKEIKLNQGADDF